MAFVELYHKPRVKVRSATKVPELSVALVHTELLMLVAPPLVLGGYCALFIIAYLSALTHRSMLHDVLFSHKVLTAPRGAPRRVYGT